jgi:hypothetical protein
MDLAALCDYYATLLAYEYRGQPNATRQMRLYAKQMVGDLLAGQVITAYDIDTAIGAQLDVLGKYLGTTRALAPGTALAYFGCWNYTSTHTPANYQGTWVPSTNTPALPAASGATNKWYAIQVAGTSTAPIAATFAPGDLIYSNGTTWVKVASSVDNGNGLTDYTSFPVNANALFYSYLAYNASLNNLTDDQYRVVLKLQSINNTNKMTLASIMEALWAMFGSEIQLTDNKDMTMTYNVSYLIQLPTSVLINFLPRPMGVGLTVNGFTPTPPPSTATYITTEAGDRLTTEAGDPLITE